MDQGFQKAADNLHISAGNGADFANFQPARFLAEHDLARIFCAGGSVFASSASGDCVVGMALAGDICHIWERRLVI